MFTSLAMGVTSMVETIVGCKLAGASGAGMLVAIKMGMEFEGSEHGENWIEDNIQISDCVLWIGDTKIDWHRRAKSEAARVGIPFILLGDRTMVDALKLHRRINIVGGMNINVVSTVGNLCSVIKMIRRMTTAS